MSGAAQPKDARIGWRNFSFRSAAAPRIIRALMASPRTPAPPTPRQVAPRLLTWFAEHARDLPWRRTRDPYAIWVSEIMLQQTQVKTVVPYWERWMRVLPDVAALARAKPAQLHKLWEGLGYYSRVRNLQRAAQVILARHGGVFPRDFAAILELPGIGRYTAGAIASIAFNQPAPILDGNVIRVLTRLHGIADDPRGKPTNARLWHLAGELVAHAARLPPPDAKSETRNPKSGTPHPCSALNQSLMELGALVCTPRSPDCPACPLARLCAARRLGRETALPRRPARAAVTARRFVVLVLERGGKFLVRQRPAGVVNAHLWEFPNVEVEADTPAAAAARRWLGRAPVRLTPLVTVKHAITRYRIVAEAHRVEFTGRPPAGVWRTPAQLARLAFPAAHRCIARELGRKPRKPAKTGQNAV